MQKVADKAVSMQTCTGYNATWTAVAERTSRSLCCAACVQVIAMARLKAKLVVLAEERQLAAVAELRGDAVKAEWGQQVGSPGFSACYC